MVRILCFCCCFLLLPGMAAGQADAYLIRKADTLKRYLSRADTLSPFSDAVPDVTDTIAMMNERIGTLLTDILTYPGIAKVSPDSLLAHPFLGIIHSPD